MNGNSSQTSPASSDIIRYLFRSGVFLERCNFAIFVFFFCFLDFLLLFFFVIYLTGAICKMSQ